MKCKEKDWGSGNGFPHSAALWPGQGNAQGRSLDDRMENDAFDPGPVGRRAA
jgi:hypothetical protein